MTAVVKIPGSVLRPGLFARARITASTLKDAVVVPQRAMMEIKAAISLPSSAPMGRRRFAPRSSAARTRGLVIASGLKAGEKVIVEGIQKVKAGMQVAAKPWIPSAERSTAPAVETKPAEHPET